MPLKNRRADSRRGPWMSMRHLWLDEDDLTCLTPREREVLAWMGWGLERDEIAAQICRSAKTVDKVPSSNRRQARSPHAASPDAA